MLRSALINITFLMSLVTIFSCAEKEKNSLRKSSSKKSASVHSGDAQKADPADQQKGPEKKSAESDAQRPSPKVQYIQEARSGTQISQTFLSSKIEKAELEISGNKKRIDSELTLNRELVEKSDTLKQATRIKVTDRFDQGLPETTKIDVFSAEVSYGAVDIIVVIDNSASMRQEQQELSNKLSALLSNINHSDWQIGVITTDKRQQNLRDLIKKGDADAAQSFANAINAGTGGSGKEQGLLMAQIGLKAKVDNKPWVRKNSVIAVLIVSDEDNCSTGCSTAADGRVGTLKAYLDSIRAANEARIYGIIDIPNALGLKSCQTSYKTGKNYKKAIDSTGGQYGSICAASYTPTLEAISQNIKTILKKEFILSEIPVTGSVQVFINNIPSSDFTLNGKVLKLTKDPASNATIRVEYITEPSTMTSEFQLSKENFLNDSFSVTVNGTQLAKDDYRIEEGNIILATEPEAKAVIKVSYLLDDPVLTNNFALSDIPLDHNALTVTVNGSKNTDFSYDNSQNKIIFTKTPEEGADIKIAYQIKGSPILNYDIASIVKNQNFIGAFDKDTGSKIEGIKLDNKNILTIPESAFSDGKKIIVRTEVNEDPNNITLPVTPIENSVAIVKSSCGNDVKFSVKNKTINIQNCDIKDGNIVFEYSYEAEKKKEFSIAKMVPANINDFSLDVFVNNKATEDYTLKDKVIKFTKYLAPASEVKVVVGYYMD